MEHDRASTWPPSWFTSGNNWGTAYILDAPPRGDAFVIGHVSRHVEYLLVEVVLSCRYP